MGGWLRAAELRPAAGRSPASAQRVEIPQSAAGRDPAIRSGSRFRIPQRVEVPQPEVSHLSSPLASGTFSRKCSPIAEPPDAVEPPFDPALVADLLRQLDKTVRAHQLYPSHNAQYIKTVENLRVRVRRRVAGSVRHLAAGHRHASSAGATSPSSSEPEKVSDSLPWTFFKDGVREITLTRGFEGEELEKLLDIIPLVRRAHDHEDDILTLLWEQEFVFLSYRFIDTVSGQGAPLDPSATPGRWPAQASVCRYERRGGRCQAAPRLSSGAPPGGSDEAARLDRALAAPAVVGEGTRPDATTARQTSYLAREIELEYSTDLRRDVLDVLLDIFELNDDTAVRAEVIGHLDAMMLHLLTGLQFGNVTHLLRESAVALDRAPGVTPRCGRASKA